MINTREITREFRLSQWAKIIQERSQSGLTIKAFCQRLGICANTYFYWQRKLREAACREILPDADSSEEKALVPGGWAVCVPEQPRSDDGAITIEIGQCKVKVACNASPEALEKVCRVLMRLC